MEKKYIIGVDSGTTRIKAVLFDLDGNELYAKGMKLTPYTPYEDWYEQDMNEIWEKGAACMKEVVSKVNAMLIAAIGVTAQGDGLWMMDSTGNPVRKGMCFCDGRTSEIIQQWREDGTLEQAFDISGTAAFGSSICAEIRWLEQHEPDSMQRAAHVFHLKDWLFYKLTGEVSSDDTDMCIPMLNAKTRQYDDRLFQLYGIEKHRNKFPALRVEGENKALIRGDVAQEMGLGPNVIVTGGPVDISASALSCGAVENGQALSIIGTAAIHSVVLDEPRIEPRMLGMTFMHYPKDRWIRLMSSMCGSPNLEWFLDKLGGDIRREAEQKDVNLYDYCSQIIREVPIGANGVVYYPYLLAGGERAPFFKSNIKASFMGISFNTDIRDMLRAVYEGVALAMRDCYSAIPTEVTEIIVTGGGSNSDEWMQMFADATGKDIVTFLGKEHSARGAAISAGVAAGAYSSYATAIAQVAQVKKRYRPDATRHQRYTQLYNLYRTGYMLSMDWWDGRSRFLADLAE